MAGRPERNTFVVFALEQLAAMGEITARKMMGGRLLYADGILFALIARDELYLKADDQNRALFTAAAWPAFQPWEDGQTVMSYYRVPAEILDHRAELARWAAEAVAAGRRTPPKPKKRRS